MDFVQRLGLARRCGDAALVDVSGALGDARALQQLLVALWRPFAQLRVAQVVALGEKANGAQKAAKKRTRRAEVVPQHPELICRRVVGVEVGGSRRVQLPRQSVAAGRKVLLVTDWVDGVEDILAARDAIATLGAEVVGVGFVAATSAAVLDALKQEQILFSCAWMPAPGVALAAAGDQSVTRSIVPTGDAVVVADSCSCHTPAPHRMVGGWKRKRSVDEESGDLATASLPFLTHVTAHYQGNNPSEDRSFNCEKSDAEGGGCRGAVASGCMRCLMAMEDPSLSSTHVQRSLCQRILSQVADNASAAQVTESLAQAFVECDEELKHALLALPAETHLAKGYCNSGACAAVALFVNTTLYVANVGDCAVVLGKAAQAGGAACVASQLSVDHTCANADETRGVLERSRDRNPIRLSKDDQTSGAGEFGVKRVAGSLAVTRAFGDFYLKCEELSSAPFKSKLPYITVEPSVAAVELDGSEKYLILGSDGLWEVLAPEEAVQIVDSFDPAQSLFFSTVSAALIHAALEKIAHRDGLMLHEVLALPPGPARRRFHDDITCTVVYIQHATRGESPGSEAPPVGDIVSATPTTAANDGSPSDLLS
ncbi:hypothetical protein PybrP1_001032 [[Pythium] brassicae (nom. inval.)]|nr:hypothetical protein PybrP1_001032 [[Pythium] brassicae (nom. inval.)]